MATDSIELSEYLSQNPPEIHGDFRTCVYYGEEEDALTFIFRPDAEYARRLNSRVTAYFSMESNRLVGCQIKNVKRVLNDIGWFDVQLKDKDSKLTFLFILCLGTFLKDPEATDEYKNLVKEVIEQSEPQFA